MDSPGLAYVLAHPGVIGLSVATPSALLLLLALPVFFRWPHPRSRWAAWLRSGAFVAVVTALAGVEFTTRLPTDHLTVVAAIDTSPSIDAAGREWAREYVHDLQAQLAPGDHLAVLAFGAEATLVRPPAPPAGLADAPDASAASVTDLGAAIDAAAALLPGDGDRRILLLTDGNESRGDAAARVAWLGAAGIRLDAAVPPQDLQADVRVDKLSAPLLAGANHPVPIRIVAHNAGPTRPAVLNVYLDDQMADSTAVELERGRNAFQLTPTLPGAGGHRLRAELAIPDDPRPPNNSAEVGVTLREHLRVLVLSPRRHPAIARALERKGARVDLRAPAGLRSDEVLRPYHVVVLEDVTATTLPPATLTVLERWVRERGGGLVLAGGASTFGDAAFASTALARLLPVTLEPTRPKPGAREPMAIMLVVDRSNSMGYNSRRGTLRDGEKLRYAKEASLAVVRQLKDQDLLGVIAFDSRPYDVAPLRALRDSRRSLETLIPKLVENGGTDFLDALANAHRQLRSARVRNRHILLLTDGDTNRAAPAEYAALTKAIAADGIRVTTIRIGDNTVNLELLRTISRATGGEFHYVANARALPDLMLRETARAIGPAAPSSETHHPEVAGRGPLLQGLDDQPLPPLSGYAFARPRDGAEVLLRVPRDGRDDPLLAVWQHGLGRVCAFTASPGNDAEAWAGWRDYTRFWSQMAHWAAREQAEDEFAISARRTGGVTDLEVRAFGPDADGMTVTATLQLDADVTRDVALVPREPRLFTASLLDVPPGRYPITIVTRRPDGAVGQRAQTVSVPAGDDGAQREFERSAPNLALLGRLTASTGGHLNEPPAALVERQPGTRRATYPLDRLLLPLALLLFLADTAMRLLGHPARAPVTA